MRKIILDCDTGTDDAIAIIASLYSKEAEVAAFTTVDGNASIDHTSRNTLNLVRQLGFDTPVAVGAASQLKRRAVHGPGGVHGSNGLGGIELIPSKSGFSEQDAVTTIYEGVKKARGDIDIVAIGPLTNIAMTLITHPDLGEYVNHIYVMGGAISGGNMNHTAEFNIWKDPEAARIVFAAGIPCTMVGLDVTKKAILNEDDARKLRALNTEAANIAADILAFMFIRRDAGGEDALMHDSLALAAAVRPECVVTKPYFVDVECEGTYTFGHTFVDTKNRLKKKPNVNVAVEINLPAFKEWLHTTIANSKA
ncbi:MAG: nucleoside hydrolase [Clostridiales bacterium]|jgi:inosine-uridine nucleoside N-ribohydrolase|nr:nucleoside hydrolase [Clostridiales bacterium]